MSLCAATICRPPRTKPTMPDSSTAPPGASDWAALPRDILFTVFLKLGPREIMLAAELVCAAWRRFALEEPTLWRRIGWDDTDELMMRLGVDVEAMERVALARSAGQCEAFRGYLDYEDLPYLVERAPSLKTLDTKQFNNYNGTKELIVALEKLPLLENLQISFTCILECGGEMLRSVCHACPNLKKLVLIYAEVLEPDYWNAEDFCMEPMDGEIPLMHELHTLELYECDLSATGLKGILDNCPVLESLHVTGCFNKHDIDQELQAKCARVKNLSLPTNLNPSDRRYYHIFGDPEDSQDESFDDSDDSHEDEDE
ncbi:hypothetical protein EJB05_47390 [Eragrostis curvula]|uniref:F-box domain-containing protein n=1 Tax=Eragrostis curvula TaxID=38414 RepID=A0A5J9T7F3_9POAL|nr:hypothetical protein EJB05_47390 [Eragrostis curvula]